MKFELPPLLYSYNAMEPYLDAETMNIHHDKHHQGYVNRLNDALDGYQDLENKSIEELLGMPESIPEKIRSAVLNNGGGHYNHSLFWTLIGPAGENEGEPNGKLGELIKNQFGDFSNFKGGFSKAAAGVLGSGWAWLVVNTTEELILNGKKLSIITTPNQDTPISRGLKPILVIDVWEHAYYLKYQNRRPDYIDAWWNVVNWKKAEELLG